MKNDGKRLAFWYDPRLSEESSIEQANWLQETATFELYLNVNYETAIVGDTFNQEIRHLTTATIVQFLCFAAKDINLLASLLSAYQSYVFFLG